MPTNGKISSIKTTTENKKATRGEKIKIIYIKNIIVILQIGVKTEMMTFNGLSIYFYHLDPIEANVKREWHK